jgi:5,10-methylenetetrahydromethanopterin reductase
MPIELHAGVPVGAPLAEQVVFIKRAEELGYAGAGIADDPRFGADPFVTLAAAAAETRRIWLYPAATNPVTRHPVVLAGLANSLAILAPGRVKLAIGTGDGGVELAGLRPAKLSRLREAVVGIQALLRGEPAYFGDGPKVTLDHPAAFPPPVMMAASGARTLEAAGSVADEILVTSAIAPEATAAVFDHIGEGATRARRRARPIPLTYYTLVSIDEDRERAIERTRPWLHFFVRRGIFKLSLKAMGMPVPPFESPDDIPVALLRTLAGRVFIAGTPREAAAQVARLSESGVQRLFCMFPGGPRLHRDSLEIAAKSLLGA